MPHKVSKAKRPRKKGAKKGVSGAKGKGETPKKDQAKTGELGSQNLRLANLPTTGLTITWAVGPSPTR